MRHTQNSEMTGYDQQSQELNQGPRAELGRRLCVCWVKVRLAQGGGWTSVGEQETF